MCGRGRDPVTGEIEDDAYGRVSDPQRFAPLHELAREHRDRLLASYDVDLRQATRPARSGLPLVDSWRLVPADPAASPLTFLLSDFPGVSLAFGTHSEESFPSCGCDACDEDAEDLASGLASTIETVVTGGITEAVERRGLLRTPWQITQTRHPGGSRRSEMRIDGSRRRTLGRSFHRTYAPWPPHPAR